MWGNKTAMVIVINLSEMVERRERITKQLEALGIEYVIWDAYKNVNPILGLVETVRDILRYCIPIGEPLFLLEDDCDFLPEFEKFGESVKQLPESFEILYGGCNLVERPNKLYSPNLINIKSAYTTHACLYSVSGMKKLLTAIEEMLSTSFTKPLDVLIVQTIQKEGNCYCTFPLMISQTAGYSSIEKREVDYSVFIEKRFHNQTKHLL